jgi:CRP-like cAMP-binding protein
MIYVLNAAYLCMLVALAIRNILILRIILITAQTMFIGYGIVTANYVVLLWNCLFLAINLFQVIVLLRRRAPVSVPEAIRDLYEQTFHDMTEREFLFFWQSGREAVFLDGPIVEEGHQQEEVMLVVDGSASVMKNGNEIAVLARGSFVAEMSFLSGEPASADVLCRTQVIVVTWSKANVDNLKNMNFELWSKVQHVLSRDLVGKVRSTTSRIQPTQPDEPDLSE